MILTIAIIFAINIIILTVGLKIACYIIKEEMEWGAALKIAGITSAVSVIPYVGWIGGLITLLICLVTIGEMNFWPESIMVTVLLKALTIGLTIVYLMSSR